MKAFVLKEQGISNSKQTLTWTGEYNKECAIRNLWDKKDSNWNKKYSG